MKCEFVSLGSGFARTSFGRAHLPKPTGLLVASMFSMGMLGCSEVKRKKGGSKSAVSIVGWSLAARMRGKGLVDDGTLVLNYLN